MTPITSYVVEPHGGVGPARLGMLRAAVRTAMLAAGQSYKEDARRARDLFHRNAFQVFYDTRDVVEFIELSRGGEFQVTFDATRILDVPADDAVRLVERYAPYSRTAPELGWAYIFPALDLSLWRPVTDGPEGLTFATVGVGRAGYYSASEGHEVLAPG